MFPLTVVAETLLLNADDCASSALHWFPIGVLNNNVGSCSPEEYVVTSTGLPEGWTLIFYECHNFDLNITADDYPEDISWQVHGQPHTMSVCAVGFVVRARY